MGVYTDLDYRIQKISTTPEEYEDYKEQLIDYLSGDADIMSLPQRLQNVFFSWEREQYANYGTSNEHSTEEEL